jgi:hypothetical protein
MSAYTMSMKSQSYYKVAREANQFAECLNSIMQGADSDARPRRILYGLGRSITRWTKDNGQHGSRLLYEPGLDFLSMNSRRFFYEIKNRRDVRSMTQKDLISKIGYILSSSHNPETFDKLAAPLEVMFESIASQAKRKIKLQ